MMYATIADDPHEFPNELPWVTRAAELRAACGRAPKSCANHYAGEHLLAQFSAEPILHDFFSRRRDLEEDHLNNKTPMALPITMIGDEFTEQYDIVAMEEQDEAIDDRGVYIKPVQDERIARWRKRGSPLSHCSDRSRHGRGTKSLALTSPLTAGVSFVPRSTGCLVSVRRARWSCGSCVRTRVPEEADLFFVPFYSDIECVVAPHA